MGQRPICKKPWVSLHKSILVAFEFQAEKCKNMLAKFFTRSSGRCARAYGSKEGFFLLLTRHLPRSLCALTAGPCRGIVIRPAGGGTGVSRVRVCRVRRGNAYTAKVVVSPLLHLNTRKPRASGTPATRLTVLSTRTCRSRLAFARLQGGLNNSAPWA